MVVLDVWGGDYSTEHLARFVLELENALEVAKLEVMQGYLVNLRHDMSFGPQHSFDSRIGGSA